MAAKLSTASQQNFSRPNKKVSGITTDNLSKTIKRKDSVLSLKSPEHIAFVDAIKAGNKNEVCKSMQQYAWEELWSLKFSIPLTMDIGTQAKRQLSPINNKITVQKPKYTFTGFDNQHDIGSSYRAHATMIVMPFHLAVIVNHVNIVQAMLEHIWNASKEKKEQIEALGKVLTGKTRVEFSNVLSKYEKNDRALDGMNCFHLCAKYCPAAMDEIFKFLKEHNLMGHPSVKVALEAKDHQIHQTPLHVAIKNNTATAAR